MKIYNYCCFVLYEFIYKILNEWSDCNNVMMLVFIYTNFNKYKDNP